MDRTLDCLPVGKAAVVVCVGGNSALRSRLRDYGLVDGTKVDCRYRSPDGSVTSLGCRGGVIALRTRDLKNIKGRWQCGK